MKLEDLLIHMKRRKVLKFLDVGDAAEERSWIFGQGMEEDLIHKIASEDTKDGGQSNLPS